MAVYECDLCWTKFELRHNRQRYCSKECRNFVRNLKSVKRVTKCRQNIKLKAVTYKGGKCTICGYCTYYGSLDFHHLDPNQKDFTVGNGNIKSWEKVKREIDKCILLCRNCHCEIHAGIKVVPVGGFEPPCFPI